MRLSFIKFIFLGSIALFFHVPYVYTNNHAYKRAYNLITKTAGPRVLLHTTKKLDAQQLEELRTHAYNVAQKRKDTLENLQNIYDIAAQDASCIHEVIHKASVIGVVGALNGLLFCGTIIVSAGSIWVPVLMPTLAMMTGTACLSSVGWVTSRKRVKLRRTAKRYEHAQELIKILQNERAQCCCMLYSKT